MKKNFITPKWRVAGGSLLLAVIMIAILLLLSEASSAQSIDSVNTKDTSAAIVPRRVKDAYGIRIGAGLRDHSSELLPVFNPYMEVPIGNLYFSAEAEIVFINFNTLNPFQLYSYWLDAYGWAGKCRWFYDNVSEKGFFSSAGIQMVVHPDRVSAGLPLSTGYVWGLANTTEFEGTLTFTPLVYLAHGSGYYIYFTIGLRFPNF